jgi:hypothetical protein
MPWQSTLQHVVFPSTDIHVLFPSQRNPSRRYILHLDTWGLDTLLASIALLLILVCFGLFVASRTIISGHIGEARTLPHYYLSLWVGDIWCNSLDPWLCAPQTRTLEMWRGVVKGGWSPHDREIPLRIEVPRNRSRKSKRMLRTSWEYDQ